MAALIHCPACNSPLRVPDDSDAASFTCPRCQETIPNRPAARHADDNDIRAEPVYRAHRSDAADSPRRDDDVSRPRSDPGTVSVILAAMVTALALGGLIYLQFGSSFSPGQTITDRKHQSGILMVVGVVLLILIPVAGVFVARGRKDGSWVAGLVLTIVGGVLAMLLVLMSGVVFMVTSCLEPCDSKARPAQPPKQVAPNK